MTMLASLRPEIEFMEGSALVPAKALCYKKDEKGNIIEVIKARTHKFENELKAKLKDKLKGVAIFPTKKEVFISITYVVNSENEYKSLDLDNRTKTILDALKGVVYHDDAQVKVLFADKHFLKNSQDYYYTFSIKILNPRAEKSLRNNLTRVKPKTL